MCRLIPLSLLILPIVTYAAPKDFAGLVGFFLNIIGLLIPLLFGLSLLVFLWGITNAWILNGGDEEGIKKGKQLATVGIIGLVVMSGVWGIVSFVNLSLF